MPEIGRNTYRRDKSMQSTDAEMPMMDKQSRAIGFSRQEKNGELNEDSFDLIELFWYMVSKLHIVLAAALICAIIGTLYVAFIHVPKFSATSKLYILSKSESVIDLSDLQIGNALGPDYTEVFRTWEVSQMVLEDLNLDYSYEKLQEMLEVSIPNNSRVLYLTVESADPKEAMNIANSFAKAGKTFIMQTMNTEEPNTFSRALEPGKPSTHGGVFYVLIMAVLGALLTMLTLVSVHLMDDRPRSAEDVAESCGIPVLSVIPLDPNKHVKKVKKGSKG